MQNIIRSKKTLLYTGFYLAVFLFMFVFLSVIGLGVNELCMLIGVEVLHVHYMIVKIGATAVVMVFNFITRKIFIEKKSA